MPLEIEFRGPLTKREFQNLFDFLGKKAKFIRRMKRKSFLFDIDDRTIDLKVRTTMGVPEIVLKKGLWEAKRREEIVLPLKTKSIKPALRFLALLGYNKGKVAVRDNCIFIYKNIEFTLAKCPKGCYYYEAEFINNKKGVKSPEKHIKNTLKSLKLKIWPDKEFLDFLIFLNEKIDARFSY